MKKGILTIAVLAIILVVAVGSCRKAGERLVRDDEPEQADAILMLMGRIPDRVLEVADLYHEGVAGKVWIVQEGMGANQMLEERGVSIITTTEQVSRALVDLGIPSDSIEILPGGAVSTQMEATIVRDYIAGLQGVDRSAAQGVDRSAAQGVDKSVSQGIDTLLLVSSASHMHRSHKIFTAAFADLDDPVVVLCSPSRYTDFNPEKWWRNREDIQYVVMEYLKIANFVLFEKKDLKKDLK